MYAGVLPDRITIYRLAICAVCQTQATSFGPSVACANEARGDTNSNNKQSRSTK